MDRPSQITAQHLEGWALVYVRQSTKEQVRINTGSTDTQRLLADLARKWGWPESRIEVIDEDLGRSGTSSETRTGFQRMLGLIQRGQVTLVLVHDNARLSREPLDAERFLRAATRAGILLYVNDRLMDLAAGEFADVLGFRMNAFMAWSENDNKTRTFLRAKRNRISQGNAVSPPPLGFIRPVRGKWEQDPDPEIRRAIARIFDLYEQLGSIRRVMKYHHRENLLFPRRVRGIIQWERISSLQIQQVLKNPNYTPHYVYYRTKRQFLDDGETRRSRPAPLADWKIIENHHEGYVSWARWEAIRSLLASRRRTVRAPIGNGAALLQGLLWCGTCNKPVKVKYQRKVKDERLPNYICRVADRYESRKCFWAPAEILDRVVVHEVLKILSPIHRDEAAAIIEQHQEVSADLARSRASQLRQAEEALETARRRYGAVDPAHRLVAADLEVQLERAIGHRDEVQRGLAGQVSSEPVILTPDDVAELVALASRTEELWQAPSTSNRDRKRLLETIIKRVTVCDATEERFVLEIEWVGGVRETHPILRRQGLKAVIAELRVQGLSGAQIVRALRQRGVITRLGRPLSPHSVWTRLSELGETREEAAARAYRRIRELALEGRSTVAITDELRANGPAHWGGPWTHRLVRDSLWRLRVGLGPKDLPPMPPDPEGNHGSRTEPRALELMRRWRAEGATWGTIAGWLNEQGFRPAKKLTFTGIGCLKLYGRRRKAKVAAVELEPPLPMCSTGPSRSTPTAPGSDIDLGAAAE